MPAWRWQWQVYYLEVFIMDEVTVTLTSKLACSPWWNPLQRFKKNVAVWPSIKQNLVKIDHLDQHLSREIHPYMNHFVCFSKLYKEMYLQSHLRAGKFEWCIHPVAPSWPRHSRYWHYLRWCSPPLPLPREFCVVAANIFSTIIPISFLSYTKMYRFTCTELNTPEKIEVRR